MAAAVLSLVRYQPRIFLVGTYCFALLYVVFDITPGFIYGMGDRYKPEIQIAKLDLPGPGGFGLGSRVSEFTRNWGELSESTPAASTSMPRPIVPRCSSFTVFAIPPGFSSTFLMSPPA